jgi:hypothetical protein
MLIYIFQEILLKRALYFCKIYCHTSYWYYTLSEVSDPKPISAACHFVISSYMKCISVAFEWPVMSCRSYQILS